MKKNSKTKSDNNADTNGEDLTDTHFGKISSKADLKIFLQSIHDKMTDNVAAPIYAMSAMNYLLTLPDIYTFLDNENKELARDIWLRLKQAGLQVRNPGLLFGADEVIVTP